MALTGTFQDVGFAELLQMLNVGHKTGKLTVSRPGEQAVLYFTNGEVARADSRMENGPELVYRILGWNAGEFAFERTEKPVVKNIKQSTEELILEGMKRFDEWERVEAEMPNMHVVLRQRAYAVNQHYDSLSEEAKTVLRLVDARRQTATIVRESGLEPVVAVKAITELLTEGIVEEWQGPRQSGNVLQTGGRLPEATGAIDSSAASYFSSKGQLSARRQGSGNDTNTLDSD
jgi:hypothetical protein